MQKISENMFRIFFSNVNFSIILTKKDSQNVFQNFLHARGVKKKTSGWEGKLSDTCSLFLFLRYAIASIK
jgi:hypothetical protein